MTCHFLRYCLLMKLKIMRLWYCWPINKCTLITYDGQSSMIRTKGICRNIMYFMCFQVVYNSFGRKYLSTKKQWKYLCTWKAMNNSRKLICIKWTIYEISSLSVWKENHITMGWGDQDRLIGRQEFNGFWYICEFETSRSVYIPKKDQPIRVH